MVTLTHWLDYRRARYTYSGGELIPKYTDWKYRFTITRCRKLASDNPTYCLNQMDVNPDVLHISLHHLKLPVEDLITLDELNPDHIPVLLAVNSLMRSQILINVCQSVRWDIFRQGLKPIELPLGPFLSTDALEQASKPSPIRFGLQRSQDKCAGHMRPLNTFLISAIL